MPRRTEVIKGELEQIPREFLEYVNRCEDMKLGSIEDCVKAREWVQAQKAKERMELTTAKILEEFINFNIFFRASLNGGLFGLLARTRRKEIGILAGLLPAY